MREDMPRCLAGEGYRVSSSSRSCPSSISCWIASLSFPNFLSFYSSSSPFSLTSSFSYSSLFIPYLPVSPFFPFCPRSPLFLLLFPSFCYISFCFFLCSDNMIRPFVRVDGTLLVLMERFAVHLVTNSFSIHPIPLFYFPRHSISQ